LLAFLSRRSDFAGKPAKTSSFKTFCQDFTLSKIVAKAFTVLAGAKIGHFSARSKFYRNFLK